MYDIAGMTQYMYTCREVIIFDAVCLWYSDKYPISVLEVLFLCLVLFLVLVFTCSDNIQMFSE